MNRVDTPPLSNVRRLLARFPHRAPLICTALLMLGFGILIRRESSIFLPGTPVGTVAPADAASVCSGCHNSTSPTRPVTIHSDWSGSMMAHSARDPVFYAALVVANKFNSVTGNATGEYCIRCHSPMGWLAGHSEDYTGQSLTGTDFDGIQCDYCHRVVNPLNPDSTVPHMTYPVPGYGNGMHVVQTSAATKRGPFDSLYAFHGTQYDGFQKKSELCGVCHDVSNVFYALDRITQAPHQYAPLERTYSEWLMSSFSQEGESGTCQSCHMKDTTAYMCIYASSALRTIARHDLTGGNTFVPDILPDFYTGLDTIALRNGKLRAIAMLQEAAEFHIDAYHSGDSVIAKVRITNKTGHKLPTGYPDGRRMWIYLVATDGQGDTVFRSGAYDADSAILVRDPQAKVYEMVQGLTAARAATYGLSTGPTLHFSLNDTIFLDNRIPPRGFTIFGFQQRLAQPIPAIYADSQYWDDTYYTLPSSAENVSGVLYYQTISREYVEFLRDETAGDTSDWNQWGEKLHSSWSSRGRSQPVAMNSSTVPVADSVTGAGDRPALKPVQVELMQNYPNPFNPSTTITFTVDRASRVSLSVYDLNGRDVGTLIDRYLTAGSHTVRFNAAHLSSGMYYYRLRADGTFMTKKMILIR